MKLIGQYDSPFVRRVAVAMNHYGMPFERMALSVFADFDEILALNPLGKVPVLELDGGECLFDSRMILDYLDNLAPNEQKLVPPELSERRQVLRVEAIALGLAEKCYERGIEFARRNPDKIDSEWASRLKKQIVSALYWLEAYQPDPWFCHGRFTQADITCAVAITFLQEKQQVRLEPGAYPALERHCNRCEKLPEFSASPYSAAEAARSGWKAREQAVGSAGGHVPV